MRRIRPALIVLFFGVLTGLVLFGAQMRTPVAMARPSYTSSSSSSPASNTCAGCHSGSALSGGSATITFPSGTTYTPGVAQPLTVTLTDPTHSVYSFILTARLASSVTTQAGTFTAGSGSSVAGMDIESSSFSSPTWSFNWTPPATSSGNVTFYLTGLAAGSPGGSTSGNGIYQSQFTLTPSGGGTTTPDFSLAASAVTVADGSTGKSTVTVTPSGGFTGTIALTASGLPSGVTFSPASITATSSLTFAASSTATAGTYPITFTGTSGTLTHTATFNLTVTSAVSTTPNFSLSASPSSLTVAPGSSGTSTITISPTGGFSPGTVSFTPPGLPSGVTATFSPISSAGTSTLTLAASSTAASMTVGLTITGTSGTLSHTTMVNLTVGTSGGTGAFSVVPSRLAFTYSTGSAVPPSKTLTLSSNTGSLAFTATASGGAWLTESPASGTAPGKITVSANPAGLSSGSYSGTIHITAGGITSSVPVTLVVNTRLRCDLDDVCNGGTDGSGGGTSAGLHAVPYVNDPTSSQLLTAVWVNLLGIPTSTPLVTGDPGLALSKDVTAPSGTQAGAIISSVQAPLTELGYDYRTGGQCTATSPRFVIVTSLGVTHTVGGCSKGTSTASPVLGWTRVRFNLTDATIQSSPALVPGDVISTVTLIMDVSASADPTSAGGLVVIGNIDVNGTLVGK